MEGRGQEEEGEGKRAGGERVGQGHEEEHSWRGDPGGGEEGKRREKKGLRGSGHGEKVREVEAEGGGERAWGGVDMRRKRWRAGVEERGTSKSTGMRRKSGRGAGNAEEVKRSKREERGEERGRGGEGT
eukprot:2126786-Rhodomonas_salina.4